MNLLTFYICLYFFYNIAFCLFIHKSLEEFAREYQSPLSKEQLFNHYSLGLLFGAIFTIWYVIDSIIVTIKLKLRRK